MLGLDSGFRRNDKKGRHLKSSLRRKPESSGIREDEALIEAKAASAMLSFKINQRGGDEYPFISGGDYGL
jgi:hypothetical protein